MKKLFTLLALAITSFSYGQDCIDFSQYDQQYLDSVNFMPPGTVLFAEGDLELIRPDQWSQYQFLQGDTLIYIGNMDMDASASNCAEKELTFSCVYMEGVVVDGDTVFTGVNPPVFYQGASWEFESFDMGTHIEYVVTGDFDVVHLISSTNFIWDVCLDCLNPPVTSNCIDFSQYDQQYVDSVNFLPPGSVLFQEGDLALVRPDQWTQYQWIQGDTLMYIGNLNMDVSTFSCPNKYLTFSCIYVEGMVVDGDTIFTAVNPPAFYSGTGFTFESYNAGTHIEYTIVGDFDLVHLIGSTNLIWDICLECFVGLEEETIAPQVEIYPNPADLSVTITSLTGEEYLIHSLNGVLIASGTIAVETTLDVSRYDPGLYMISVVDAKGNRSVKKLQVR